jgi:hypothetical protein
MSNKAFIVRFFADGGFRVEGPFPPQQVQRLIDSGDCYSWLRDHGLEYALWGIDPVQHLSDLLYLSPQICVIGQRRARKRYQPLRTNHYRAQHAQHWQVQP